MFDFVRNNTRVLFFVLLLLIIPSFVFFGVQGYSQFREGADGVANVAGQTITQAELDAAHRNQVERVRAQMPDVDPKLFDSPQVRRQTLEMLVRERVLAHAADDLKLLTGDERLHRVFVNDPQFAFLRNPDGTVNKDLLSAQGMSVEMFEQRLRHDLSVQQVLRGPADSTFASKSVSDRALDAFLQQREARVVRFDAKDHAARVQPTDAQIEAYYKAHESQFQMPEQVKAEYLVLDIETIKQSITVPEEELRKYYEQNASRYAAPEERRASHILI
ncbi:MAG TPA: SurA N-terminal domain-containing protein, partial [Burkholderiaceae bacterium]|nr:SurA N-terminal domain-containing protein [Burkholderiaceae bacterium]